MQFSKVTKNLSTIILIAIGIIILLDKIIKFNKSNIYVEIIIVLLLLFAFILDLYLDVKNMDYSTSKLIILADVVVIIALIALCYFHFKSVDKTNTELLWERAENIRHIGLIIVLIPSIKSILKDQRYEIKKET